ncbi:TIR domain-containing protein [Sandarakinorhabdus sp.]|uniref:TIR domain-containing protein n=1 Tax=Sandarakinorhabdus sp. TaxID=1916663 RepID=UPI00286E47C1|nr:TIR domain-containing protein [Sandarakinorhabdus sp.]
MPDIFLSYSRNDLATAGQMAAVLQAAGHDVWWDQALKAGAVYDRVTETALREARLVVVLWSAASVDSDWVRSEATIALQRGALVPVMIEACQRPVMFELRQSADLVGWKGNAKDPRLAAFLADVTRQLGTPAPAASIAMAPAGPSRRLLMGGAAGFAALVVGGFGAWKYMGGKPDDGTASVVVLPFVNLSGDASQAYFADGLAEELRNALSQIVGLKVIGRASSERFRDSADLADLAAQLGVANVLTGSVRRSANTVRISAQLSDSKTGVEIWSQSYDRPSGDVLDIQSSIATSVVGALSPRLGKAAGKVQAGGTDNVEAQALYFEADATIVNDAASAAGGIAKLDAAIALDPDYALAHSRKANFLAALSGRETDWPASRELYAQAVASSRRAVEIAPKSGRALANYSTFELALLNVRAAVAGAERAALLEPGNPDAIAGAARSIFAVNPARAAVLAGRAIALDPFSARAFHAHAEALFNLGHYNDAVVAAGKALDLSSGVRGRAQLFESLVMLGRLAEARPLIAKQTLWRGPAGIALLESRAGNRAAGDAALAALGGYAAQRTGYSRARVHAQRGDQEIALAALAEALAAEDSLLTLIAFDPFVDPLRKDPRFRAIQDKIVPPDLIVGPKRR